MHRMYTTLNNHLPYVTLKETASQDYNDALESIMQYCSIRQSMWWQMNVICKENLDNSNGHANCDMSPHKQS